MRHSMPTSKGTARYFEEIRRFPMLKAEEEYVLAAWSLPSHHLNEHAKDVVWAVTHYQTAGRLETTAACKIIGPLPSCGFGSWQGAFARWQKTSNRSAM